MEQKDVGDDHQHNRKPMEQRERVDGSKEDPSKQHNEKPSKEEDDDGGGEGEGGEEEEVEQGLIYGEDHSGVGDIAQKLPQEIEEGNVEYKWKLVNPSKERFEQLVSQLKWRLTEGMGEAIYELGVEDNGVPAGLSEKDLEASLKNLELMAKELSADTSVIRMREGQEGKVAEVLIRKYATEEFFEIRVAVVGNVDSGKSTLLGVLTRYVWKQLLAIEKGKKGTT